MILTGPSDMVRKPHSPDYDLLRHEDKTEEGPGRPKNHPGLSANNRPEGLGDGGRLGSLTGAQRGVAADDLKEARLLAAQAKAHDADHNKDHDKDEPEK
jgi:hypothetical protein